jgi:hypothetical protein
MSRVDCAAELAGSGGALSAVAFWSGDEERPASPPKYCNRLIMIDPIPKSS